MTRSRPRIAFSAIVLPALLSTVVGCAGRTETFDIELKNGTFAPLTVTLAKDGPPYEATWATPEDYALSSPRLRETWEGGMGGVTVVPPGRIADVRGVKGTFGDGTHGFVRAYRGEMTVSQMIARGKDSPDRLDILLRPGSNRIEVVDDNGKLSQR